NKGLSFLQFVIVFGLFSIIASLVIVVTNPLQKIQSADDTIRKNDIKNLQKMLEEYYRDRTRYPSSKDYKIVDFKTNLPIAWGNAWIPYMNFLPKDPNSSRNYVYYSTNNNQTYYLYAALEDISDPERCLSAGPGICESIQANNIPPNACGARCDFGVSSPNTSP
ncbi:MAG: type II secretion system protein GspG, partial [Patescibacteria group bacterium]|nr:type II secretion system protein GspG [Patescibacteria group bacterium]